jgi:hypothetical protein
VRVGKIEPVSTGTRPQHLESTSNIVTRLSCLESTSNNFSRRRLPTLLVDGTWNPPVTPREDRTPKDAITQHPQVMTRSVRHRMRRFDHEAADGRPTGTRDKKARDRKQELSGLSGGARLSSR